MIIDDEIKQEDQLPAESENYPTITQAILLALRFLLYSFFFGLSIAIIPAKFHIKQDKDMSSLILLVSYAAALLMAIWVGFVKFRKSEGVKLRLKFNRVPPVVLIVGVCIVLTMPVLTDPLNVLLPMSDTWKKIFADMFNSSVFSLTAAVIAAPILEEVFFRGIILNGLLKNYSPQTAIITSAAIFGCIHLNPWQTIPAFLAGLLIGWLYWKTNSIIPGMLLHFVNNLFSVLLGLAFKDADSIKQLMSTPVYIALFVACAAILIGGWMFLEKYFENNPTPEDDERELVAVVEE